MPPKSGKAAKAATKAEAAKKQKVAEDKTFGLKNKNKSKAVQQYVKNLQSSAQAVAKQKLDPNAEKDAQRKKKEAEAQREKELNELFKVAITQPKVPVGVDPKSIVCEFFRHGQCAKGFKCKFSHDLLVERKSAKIDIYHDAREGDEETMEDWDQEKLEDVVKRKAAEFSSNQNNATAIVCKFFLDAVERKQYGWFWSCPNGKACIYRHALPPGYVLKSQMKALLEEESNKLAVEDEIEQERHKLASSTPLTTELFAEWKRKKQEQREKEVAEKTAERAKNDRLSGRELFLSDASWFVDDDGAYAEYERSKEEEQRADADGKEASESGANGDASKSSKDDEAGPSAALSSGAVTKQELEDMFDDDDDLDPDELDELAGSVEQKVALEDTG
eukprot:TRINITY_DN16907_c0_g1_i1.p1 TRINITY_DN16907_c0_g1~~TRINITY_DN16907_c0_g1_i1.p1  ORF type:complete len:390 (+),score=146.57 TRINITY_DN16907_c0_g1_i1:139-1308(+)